MISWWAFATVLAVCVVALLWTFAVINEQSQELHELRGANRNLQRKLTRLKAER